MTEAEIDGALSQLGSFARALTGGGGGNSAPHPGADEELFGSTPLHASLLGPRSRAAAGQLPGSPAAPAASASQVCAATFWFCFLHSASACHNATFSC